MGEYKLIPLKKEPEFKDDDSGGGGDVMSVQIIVASNGFVVVYQYSDGSEISEVYHKKEDMINHVKASL